MNAIDLLLKEHQKVRDVFAEITEGSHRDETKREMFDALCRDLIVHEKMEQIIWYPHLINNKELYAVIKHLISEEEKAANIIKEFKHIKTQEEWDRQVAKLKKDVEHHADEEERKLFPYVGKFINAQELNELGKEMREFKKNVAQA